MAGFFESIDAIPLRLQLVTDGLERKIIQGLSKSDKELPSKLLYDEVGSYLFEQISELPEYYLTRTETEIMQTVASEIAALAGRNCLLIEYGSGDSKKTRILLDHLEELTAYVPIDISRENLLRTAKKLKAIYPGLMIFPLWEDFTGPINLPPIDGPISRYLAYFPGSTIGNFYPEQAIAFLQSVAHLVGPGGVLIIGVDLKKEANVLDLAYNDRVGITAEFNLNALARINREFGADFRIDRFRHQAFYNEAEGRVEMHLVSSRDQTVHLNGTEILFRASESILTEVSYKYTLEEFNSLAANAGFSTVRVWTDRHSMFSVHYLVVESNKAVCCS